jgi:cyclohexyl-isocyanide hydratase
MRDLWAADPAVRGSAPFFSNYTGGPKLEIGMLVYPGMFMLDLADPLAVFESLMNRDIHLLWKNPDPVSSEKPEHPALVPICRPRVSAIVRKIWTC